MLKTIDGLHIRSSMKIIPSCCAAEQLYLAGSCNTSLFHVSCSDPLPQWCYRSFSSHACTSQMHLLYCRVFNWPAIFGVASIGVVIWLNYQHPPPSAQAQQLALVYTCRAANCCTTSCSAVLSCALLCCAELCFTATEHALLCFMTCAAVLPWPGLPSIALRCTLL